MASPGGVFQDMKVVSLLIFWFLPFTFTGGYGHSLSCGYSEPRHAMAHGTSAVIQNADDASFPDDSGGGSLGSSLWEEDDSLEDVFCNTALLLAGSFRSRGRGELSSLVRADHDLLRMPSVLILSAVESQSPSSRTCLVCSGARDRKSAVLRRPIRSGDRSRARDDLDA